jgi:hypothetical protein
MFPSSPTKVRCLIAAIILSLNVACSSDIYPIETRALSQRNPTSYVFPGPVSEVRRKILTSFEDYELERDFSSTFSPNNPYLSLSLESREHAVFSEHIFANPENQNDLYLHFFGDVINPSHVYFGRGKPLEYRATFHLHLTGAEVNHTQVSVITHDAAVINGSVCCGLHGTKSNYVAVEPTTIEEYKILLFIGRVLGVSDMPPLKLPESK